MPQSKKPPSDAFKVLTSLKQSLGGDKSKYRFGVGLKRTGKEVLDEIVLIVYVQKKLPNAEIDPSEVVPAEFENYRTDVVELNYIPIADTGFYNPLQGGIEVSPTRTNTTLGFRVGRGTLGCIVRRRNDGQKLLLTCEHVASLSDDNGENLHNAVNQNIFQPSDGEISATIIGKCVAANEELDAAVIHSNPTRSTRCSIKEIGLIRGSGTIPNYWDQVSKRGRTTGLTSGLVLSLIAGASGEPQDVEFVGFPLARIVDHGDSGAAVLNSQQEVIALLKAMTDAEGTNAIATLIDPIQDALEIDIAISPDIYSITPNSILTTSIDSVTIDGIGFDPPAQVLFGNVPAAIIGQSNTRLEVSPPTFLVPIEVNVQVINQWGDFSDTNQNTAFKYIGK